jgi:Spy/CpxP family protein refolding chaperone
MFIDRRKIKILHGTQLDRLAFVCLGVTGAIAGLRRARMKKCLLLLTLAAAASLIWAQDQDQSGVPEGHQGHRMGEGRRPPDPAQQAKRLQKELGLSADQTAQVQKIFGDQRKKHDAEISANAALSPEQRRANFMEARQEVDTKIEAVLTDAQKQKFQQLRSKMRGRGPGAPGGSDGQQPPPPDDQQQPQ